MCIYEFSHGFWLFSSTEFPLSWKWKWKSLSRVWLFGTPWTIQSMEFSRPDYWSGQAFPSPGDLPNPGIGPRSPALQAHSLPAEPPGKPISDRNTVQIQNLFLNHSFMLYFSKCLLNNFQVAGKFKRMEMCTPICLTIFCKIWFFTQSHPFLKVIR